MKYQFESNQKLNYKIISHQNYLNKQIDKVNNKMRKLKNAPK